MKQELLLLLKQTGIQYLLALSVLLTGLSLFNGWQNIEHIQAQIAHAHQEEQHHREQQRHQLNHQGNIDAGEVGYYVFHHVYDNPDPWSFIALGNKVVAPYVQRIRLLGLQGQLYDGESHHPEYVMLGAFDYAFWMVFFLPWLCIALIHDLKASEVQANRFTFLHSMVNNPLSFWAKRVFIRWGLLLLTFIAPLLATTLLVSLPWDGFIHVLLTTVIYSAFWILVCSAVSLHKQANNASSNAIILASLWLMVCIVLPNIAQLTIHHRYPVQDGSQIALQHRQLVHNAWDLPKSATLDPFYKLYPQWQHTPPVTGRFHWKWYYAFQHMADIKLGPQIKERESQLLKRNQATNDLSYLLPSLWVQRRLEERAKSNIKHLLQHRKQIEAFHTQLRHTLYPYLFEDKPMTPSAFDQLPHFDAQHR